MKILLVSVIFVAIGSLASADMISESALRIYPNSKDAQDSYIRSERESQAKFENYPASANTPAKLLKELKVQCIHENPASMHGRLSSLKSQILNHYRLNKSPWGEDLPKAARVKIMAVGEMLWAGDYVSQYRYAISEAQAYRRLQKISFNKSEAEKKYPNSYRSQLYEVMGIRSR